MRCAYEITPTKSIISASLRLCDKNLLYAIALSPRWPRSSRGSKSLNLSTFQPFNLSTFQPFNFSTFQPFNLSTFRPFNLSTFQPFNLSTFQPFNLSTFQPFNFSTFQPFNLSTFQPFNLSTFNLYASMFSRSLSPRPERHTRRIVSLGSDGARFIASASAWLDSSAGMMPS